MGAWCRTPSRLSKKCSWCPTLVPGKWYTLRVASHSEAGTTEHDYTFSTFTRTGASIPPLNSLEGRKPAFYKSVSIMVPLLCVLAVIVLVVAVLAFIIPRRRRQAAPNHFIDSCSEDKNLEAMSLSILKQTGSSLESASPNKEQLYYPSPYAMGQGAGTRQARGRLCRRRSSCSADAQENEAGTHLRGTLPKMDVAPHTKESLDVIFTHRMERQTEEEHYSHMRDGTPAPVSNIYQTPRKAGLATRTNSDSAAQLAMEEQRLSRESRNHRLGFKSSSLASDNHSAADDSDSEGAAYTFRLTTNGSYGDHQEMSEAECDRDQHTRAKHLEALGIHVTPGYGIT
ncbi:hypothetical protein MTO96_015194 [Rhipicephalus appendiculatus]